MLVQQILNSKADLGVLSVKPTALVSEAVAILSEKRIGTVVVSSDGHSLDGILSERDIVRELGRRGVGCLSEPVENLMTKKIVTCSTSDSADFVLQTMTDVGVAASPV